VSSKYGSEGTLAISDDYFNLLNILENIVVS